MPPFLVVAAPIQHHRPRAPPPAVRLIQPLKDELDKAGAKSTRIGRENVHYAGYRNSVQMAALLETKRLTAGLKLHPAVVEALRKIESNETAGHLLDDNLNAIAGDAHSTKIFRWTFFGGLAAIAAGLATIMEIAPMISVISTIGGFVSVLASANIGLQPHSSDIQLIDTLYEFLSVRENQEALAQKMHKE